jgi:hypothetical protein
LRHEFVPQLQLAKRMRAFPAVISQMTESLCSPNEARKMNKVRQRGNAALARSCTCHFLPADQGAGLLGEGLMGLRSSMELIRVAASHPEHGKTSLVCETSISNASSQLCPVVQPISSHSSFCLSRRLSPVGSTSLKHHA